MPTDVVSASDPWHLAIDNNMLYFVEGDLSKVSKFDITPLSLSLNDLNLESAKVQISPNPTSEFIKVEGLTAKQKYTIYTILGAEIKKGTVQNKENIDIKNLKNGAYLLKFANRNTIKFIKE